MEFDNNNPNIIGLDLPMKESRGLAGLFLRYYSTLAALVCDTKGNTDYRVEMFVDTMISSIPENDIRDKLRELKKEMIRKRTKDIDNVSDKNREITKISLEIVGEISNYIDMYLGTSKKISVSVETAYPGCECEKKC